MIVNLAKEKYAHISIL